MNPRILAIEDDAPLAAVLERGLRLAGYEVDLAEDASSGAEHWRRGDYSAVILDVMLPGQDGIELCRAMRAAGDSTPVLLLTARDDQAKRAAGLAAGASVYVTKPFVYADLIALIRRLERQGRGSGSPLPVRSR
jgi:DNA-binding response OmpR family regulator